MTWLEKNHICCGTFQNLNATNLKLTTREYAWPRMLSTTHQQVRSVAGIRLLYWMFIINNFKSGFNPRVLIGVGRLSSPYSNAIFWQDKSQKTQTVFTIFKNTNFSSILQWGWIYCFSDSKRSLQTVPQQIRKDTFYLHRHTQGISLYFLIDSVGYILYCCLIEILLF